MPEAYRSAAESLDIEPRQMTMVAAHNIDIKGAASAGLRTAHVTRPSEYGPNAGEPAPRWDDAAIKARAALLAMTLFRRDAKRPTRLPCAVPFVRAGI